jgi:hypothetical protein
MITKVPGLEAESSSTTSEPWIKTIGPFVAAVVAICIAASAGLLSWLRRPRFAVLHENADTDDDRIAVPRRGGPDQVRYLRIRLLNQAGWWLTRRTAEDVQIAVETVRCIKGSAVGPIIPITGRMLRWTLHHETTTTRLPPGVARYADVIRSDFVEVDGQGHVRNRLLLIPEPSDETRYDMNKGTYEFEGWISAKDTKPQRLKLRINVTDEPIPTDPDTAFWPVSIDVLKPRAEAGSKSPKRLPR